ncbi:MAG: reactive intermediate/imine deaminase [Actinobacteria bacterium]|nr:reactive intermediate/imine deaminase [Actinomycetota bacterium]
MTSSQTQLLQFISTDQAPAPLGHYSQAVRHQGLLYVSGQLAIQADGHIDADMSVADQTRLTLDNIAAIVTAAGGKMDHVIKVTIYIADINIWPEVNATYADYFGDHRPARVAAPVPALPKGLMIEMDAIVAVS